VMGGIAPALRAGGGCGKRCLKGRFMQTGLEDEREGPKSEILEEIG